MKVLFNFKLPDGNYTENFTEEDIDNIDEKVSAYGITSEDLEKLFFKPVKILLESAYPVEVTLKDKKDDSEVA